MTDQTSISYYVTIVRRSWWLILLLAVAVGAAAFSGSRLQGERFRSTATILYTPAVIPTSFNQGDPNRAVDTLVALVQTDAVLEDALPKSGYATTGELWSQLDVRSGANSDLIYISVSARSAAQAAAATAAVSQSFLDWRTEKERQLVQARIDFLNQQLASLAGSDAPSDLAAAADLRTQLSQAGAQLEGPSADLTIVQPASLPDGPYAPHPLRNSTIGFFVGLFFGIAIALVRDRLDRRLRDIEELEPIYRAPVLGIVPFVARAARGHRAAALGDFGGRSPAAEAFRTIRTNLALFTPTGDVPQVLVISSAIPEEGKSAATANLSAAFAAGGKNVLAISADVRSPTLHRYFEDAKADSKRPLAAVGVHARRSRARPGPDHGVIEVLSGQVTLEDAVRRISLNGSGPDGATVTVLASGRQFFDPASLYESEAMRSMLSEARERYDVVVIDAPPLLVGGDCSVLAHQADAFLMVAQIGRLTRDTARRAARLMDAAQIRPLGIIVTGRGLEAEAYGYGYGYGKQA